MSLLSQNGSDGRCVSVKMIISYKLAHLGLTKQCPEKPDMPGYQRQLTPYRPFDSLLNISFPDTTCWCLRFQQTET